MPSDGFWDLAAISLPKVSDGFQLGAGVRLRFAGLATRNWQPMGRESARMALSWIQTVKVRWLTSTQPPHLVGHSVG